MTCGGSVSEKNLNEHELYQKWFDAHQYQQLFQTLDDISLSKWKTQLSTQLPELFALRHGQYQKWFDQSQQLPKLHASNFNIIDGVLSIESDELKEAENKQEFLNFIRNLSPWRKGPYCYNDIFVDTEWRSDLKWDRLVPHIHSLKDKKVLDIGCGNGYHCWRMHEHGANLVVGVDPSWLFLAQFQAFKQFLPSKPVYLLPMGIEQLPENFQSFDTVFSMGVFYHRRSPIDHLFQLKQMLVPHGQLVLETLIIDGELGECLLPKDRYAKMRNVWFLPTIKTLISWMERCGFINIKMVSVSTTTSQEQRKTDWIETESLVDFLDPDDPCKTIEGYPAPKRAIFVVDKA
ncbi:MAG: tRNA 5-methoxyuridine(34)/uridine 5-oxyacetic acid(34) synthase CmoB [Gammaproteobacteria bacterium]|nr:tRNA 5-methoxyuridine(34)/uridine 5-oxyacetic acid(34) synthase CmoB [Gammaproteobacteria bacterium]